MRERVVRDYVLRLLAWALCPYKARTLSVLESRLVSRADIYTYDVTNRRCLTIGLLPYIARPVWVIVLHWNLLLVCLSLWFKWVCSLMLWLNPAWLLRLDLKGCLEGFWGIFTFPCETSIELCLRLWNGRSRYYGYPSRFVDRVRGNHDVRVLYYEAVALANIQFDQWLISHLSRLNVSSC